MKTNQKKINVKRVMPRRTLKVVQKTQTQKKPKVSKAKFTRLLKKALKKMASKISKELRKSVIESWGAMSTLYQILGRFGIKLQQLNKMFYKRTSRYSPDPFSFLVYKQLVQAQKWVKGVNQKTFFAKSPYNQIVGWVHDGKEQIGYGCLFNMILQDGTRSDNPFIDYGDVE